MEPHGIPVVYTCLFFCRVRFELVLLHVVRGRWKLLVDDGLWWVGSDSSLLVCRDQLRPSFRPWVNVAREPDEPSSSEMDDLHFIISSIFFGLEFTDKLECLDERFGLPRSRLPCNTVFMMLVSSVYVMDGEPSASLASYVGPFFLSDMVADVHSLVVILGSLGLGKGPEQT